MGVNSKLLTPYRGRFAPSPTGPLHFGSLVAALGSFLDAQQHNGSWLVRIEDLDPPREQVGASASILRTLESFHLFWDEDVLYQHQRHALYEDHCQQLLALNRGFYCSCSRSQLKGSHHIYPGTCRNHLQPQNSPCAIRFRIDDEELCFHDQIQGQYCQHLRKDVGDIVIKRKDQLYAYQLAVVCDDHAQGVTHVVRGSDLLDNTPRQLALYRALRYPMPCYAHLPIVVNETGQKLSKQNQALPLSQQDPRPTLLHALAALQLHPPKELRSNNLDDILLWANNNWNPSLLSKQRSSLCPQHLL